MIPLDTQSAKNLTDKMVRKVFVKGSRDHIRKMKTVSEMANTMKNKRKIMTDGGHMYT